MPPEMQTLIQYSLEKGDVGQALQSVTNWRNQQGKNAAAAIKGADNPMLAGGSEMDTAAVIAQNRFMKENNRPPGPQDSMVMAGYQT